MTYRPKWKPKPKPKKKVVKKIDVDIILVKDIDVDINQDSKIEQKFDDVKFSKISVTNTVNQNADVDINIG